MAVFDTRGRIVEAPDLGAGLLEDRVATVTHRWVVDVEEVTHTEVVAEYPETGGKDLAIVVDVPEKGHWDVVGEDGGPVEGYDGPAMPDDAPHDVEYAAEWAYHVYRPLTDAEAAAALKERERAEKAAREEAARAALMEAMPDAVDEVAAAVAELGGMAADNAVTIAELAQAVAELGAMIGGAA